ncbi:MAG: hypothetical protein ACLQVG_07585, partial [Terriglobia bacterium]
MGGTPALHLRVRLYLALRRTRTVWQWVGADIWNDRHSPTLTSAHVKCCDGRHAHCVGMTKSVIDAAGNVAEIVLVVLP